MDYGKLVSTGIALYGSMQSKKKEGKSLDAYQDGLQLLQNIVPPTLADLSIELTQAVQQGELSPEEYIAYMAEKSAMEGIEIPQQLKDIQYDALNQMNEISNSGGMTDIDKARLNEIKGEMLSSARGLQKSTQQNMASRGISGSGVELASQLSNDSANIEAASKGGYDVAAEAQRRALDAIKSKSTMAGNLRTQEFGEQEAKAKATDAVNDYNTRVRQAVSNANINDRNNAEAKNLAERQRIADVNTGIKNQEEEKNTQARQTVFDNAVKQTIPQVQQGNNIGREVLGGAERDENQYANISKAVGGYFDKPATPGVKTQAEIDVEEEEKRKKSQKDFDESNFNITSDQRVKKNITKANDDEIDDLFDHLTAHKFNYKKGFKSGNNDTQLGIMAQHMEKTPLGKSVVIETDGLKKLDGKKAMSLALAALASHSKKIKKLEGKK